MDSCSPTWDPGGIFDGNVWGRELGQSDIVGWLVGRKDLRVDWEKDGQLLSYLGPRCSF